MRLKPALLAAAMLVPAVSPPAHSEPAANRTILWKRVQTWTVASDPALGYGCYMHTGYPNGVGLRFGFSTNDPKNVYGYLMLMNQAWTSLVTGQNYSVQVKFDNVPHNAWVTWTGVASLTGAGMPALFIPFKDLMIFVDAAGATGLHITYQGKAVINGNLPGSSQAATEMALCQKAMDDRNGTSTPAPSDPFRGSRPTPPGDPFRPA